MISDFKSMLPDEAKQVLIRLILERLEVSGLNSYAQPKYRLVDAIREFEGQLWELQIIFKCFEAAEKEYNTKHGK